MAPVEVTVEGYRPEEVAAGAPRSGTAPLFSLGRTTIFAGADQRVFVAAGRPQPLRLWARGELGGEEFAGLNEEGTLFAEGSGQWTGALLGLQIALRPR